MHIRIGFLQFSIPNSLLILNRIKITKYRVQMTHYIVLLEPRFYCIFIVNFRYWNFLYKFVKVLFLKYKWILTIGCVKNKNNQMNLCKPPLSSKCTVPHFVAEFGINVSVESFRHECIEHFAEMVAMPTT